MKLYQLKEAIQQEDVVKIFSTLVTAVNNMSDIVGADGLIGDEAAGTLSELNQSLKSSNDRIARLDFDANTWESMSSSMQGAPKSWNAARALISRRLIPEIIASVKLVLQKPGQNLNAITMLRERIANAQALLTGSAPVGQAAAAAVDDTEEIPKAPVQDSK